MASMLLRGGRLGASMRPRTLPISISYIVKPSIYPYRQFWSSQQTSADSNSSDTRIPNSSAVTERRETLPDVRGLPVATGNWKALEQLDLGVWDYARWNGDVCGTARKAIEHDPTCVLAHCLNAIQLLSHRGAAASHPEVLAAMKANRQLLSSEYGGEREMVHATAVEAWAAGNPRRAASVWEAWLLKEPRDLMALRASHDAHLACGDAQGALDSIARAKPQWEPSVFGYGQVLSMHAYALTEVNLGNSPENAEEMAHVAYGMDKKDNWALNALVHVYDHGGRASEGQSLLKNCRDWWETLPEKSSAIHFAVHLSKFYIERGNYKAALRILDTGVMEVLEGAGSREYLGVQDAFEATQSLMSAPNPYALMDATSLLWRLELSGVNCGFRWCKIADYWDRISPGVLDEGMRSMDGEGEEAFSGSEGLMLSIHRLSPLQAVHRSMAAVAMADITGGIAPSTTPDLLTASDTGVELSFGEMPDLALAWQRKMDISFAEAAAEQANRLRSGDLELRLLPERCMPSSVLVVANIDEDEERQLLLESGNAYSNSSSSSSGGGRSSGEDYEPLTGIEHLFDEMDGSRPLAPRAPFVREPLGSTHGLAEQIAQNVAVGAVAFWQRDLSKCIDILLPYKAHFHRLGGSILDQETLMLTLLEAAVRSSAPTSSPSEYHFSVTDGDELENEPNLNIVTSGVSGLMLARALLAERTANKTGSAQAWIRYAVVLQRLGDVNGAEMAMRNAYALGIGQGGKGAH